MLAEAISHTGLVRRNNEDAYLIISDLKIFAVADGMGGHAAGEIASKLAVNTLAEYINKHIHDHPPARVLADAVAAANEEIYFQAVNHPSHSGMGTTLSAVWVVEDIAYLAHIGDSRIYLFRDEKLDLVTCDHSFVSEMVRNGNLTAQEAEKHPQRNLLTRALGTESNVEVDMKELTLQKDDILLCCTDGLSAFVSADELEQMIRSNKDTNSKLQQMLQLALNRGGHDNITAMLVYNIKRRSL
ncbi:Stp1/IreP family PP2C-type Ser/Thr phosphatase [Metallumcola ferriviriculae]|uniref:Stp1/IreP family PP2C-type Ser/Thr phosphatase n=1 Tax=Metallumcola ferriviriculae TaxID=3039180 RepID=A0AAU0UPQ8_9FIRM|nr:Stp1/IreP family PP2C-type Ser/Thr phosphatase [Desulfitibacteraceae bacterium MK1]